VALTRSSRCQPNAGQAGGWLFDGLGKPPFPDDVWHSPVQACAGGASRDLTGLPA
jgi:hypothetical protein